MSEQKPKIYLIVGPTASGKTAAGIDVARRMGAEIVSADSIQVYKGLDVGSAKPTTAEMGGVVHHLLDFVDIEDRSYNVSAFRALAVEKIHDIISRGKPPLIVGGTGLYINSITFPLDFSQAEPDNELRAHLMQLEAAQSGTLHARLSAIDPSSAERLHPNDTKRLIRAIEVYEKTGIPLSAHGGDFVNSRGGEIEFDPIIAGIDMERALLYERIEQRVDKMLADGLLDEVDSIIAKGCDKSLPALQGLGYKQLIAYRNGELTLDEAVETIKRDTRRFAKRQLSWFRRDKRIRWFRADELKTGLAGSIYDYFINGSD